VMWASSSSRRRRVAALMPPATPPMMMWSKLPEYPRGYLLTNREVLRSGRTGHRGATMEGTEVAP
jgi:hypothetical protein